MQMNNIAPAIAAALTLSALTLSGPATAAGENVIVYGQANVSYDMISTGTTTGLGSSSGISSSRVSSNSSRIGLKGSNQLGKGWSAVWQAEASVATDTGAAGVAPASVSTSTTTQVPPVFPATTTTYATVTTTTTGTPQIFDRDTYLGIYNEDYGTLLAGRHDTPYKMSTRRLDVFADGIADNRSLMGTTMFGGAGGVVIQTFDVRMSDMIAYISPNFRSFSIALGYSNLAEGNMNMNQANASALSLAVMYEKDPVYATFAYEVYTTTPPKDPATAVKAAKLGLGYKLGIFDLGFAY
ncbi:MAG: porin, partial [Gallionella sp.]